MNFSTRLDACTGSRAVVCSLPLFGGSYANVSPSVGTSSCGSGPAARFDLRFPKAQTERQIPLLLQLPPFQLHDRPLYSGRGAASLRKAVLLCVLDDQRN